MVYMGYDAEVPDVLYGDILQSLGYVIGVIRVGSGESEKEGESV